MGFVDSTGLRASFAVRLSELYGTEVPAYTTLVEVAHEVNSDVVARLGAEAERLGSIDRVTAERHGAIRVGTPEELAQVARVFAAMGMYPVGFYDLRDAVGGVPVVSTAFRPIDEAELAKNPFRVFTSVLAITDRRYFTEDQQRRLEDFLGRRELFPGELLTLADAAVDAGGLDEDVAERFLTLATASFELSPEPVDRLWYEELEKVSSVASDIGGVSSTHINHLTPRVLDIDELYARMSARGVVMIDDIQGPPCWQGPDVLLRQTSFRALAEARSFREPDGSIVRDSLRVRFGEVEARGVALTPAGREVYDRMMLAVDDALAGVPRIRAAEKAAEVWASGFPDTEIEMAAQGLAYYRYTAVARDGAPPEDVPTLIREGWLLVEPIVYEDFLPRSAAGIFQSNLTSEGSKDTTQQAVELDEAWMAGVLGRTLNDPYELYAAQSEASLASALAALTPEARAK